MSHIKQLITRKSDYGVLKYLRYINITLRRALGYIPFAFTLSESSIQMQDSKCGASVLAYVYGLYDRENMRLIKNYLTKDSLFLDVGANIGTYSLIASEVGCRVISFEPHPITLAKLKNNVALNPDRAITIYGVACGADEREVRITNQPVSALNSITTEENQGETYIVTQRRIDSIVSTADFADCDKVVMKIDVEGYELEVLKGAIDIIKGVHIVIIEVKGHTNKYGEEASKIGQWLRDHQFNGPLWYCNETREFSMEEKAEDPIYRNDR